MARVIERGRCAYDGYVRGTSLAHGNLAEQVWNDPLFRWALKIARLPQVKTMCTEARLMNLYLLLKFYLPKVKSQNIVEYGSFKGGSALFMAAILKEVAPARDGDWIRSRACRRVQKGSTCRRRMTLPRPTSMSRASRPISMASTM
jgi:hypothetical protein